MKYHQTAAWQKYLLLMKERPDDFAQGPLEIVTDAGLVDRFYEENRKELGVLYRSPYHILVVDLVRDMEDRDRLFAYERLLPAADGAAVVAVPVYNGKFILLCQFRHAVRKDVLAFPRGFGENGLGSEDNLKKELKEELQVDQVEDIRPLGSIAADTGSLSGQADVYFCRVSRPRIRQGYEEIEELVYADEAGLRQMIARGEIIDGFTLAAFALYQEHGKMQ